MSILGGFPYRGGLRGLCGGVRRWKGWFLQG